MSNMCIAPCLDCVNMNEVCDHDVPLLSECGLCEGFVREDTPRHMFIENILKEWART